MRDHCGAYLDARKIDPERPAVLDIVKQGENFPPLEKRVPLTLDEKYALLTAIHDEVCHSEEKLGPVTDEAILRQDSSCETVLVVPVEAAHHAMRWAALESTVRDWLRSGSNQAHAPQAKSWLADVRADLAVELSTPAVGPPDTREAIHKAALACLEALARIHNRTVSEEALGALRNAVNCIPDLSNATDPFAGTVTVEFAGRHGVSWHKIVCDVAQDWEARTTTGLADNRRRSQELQLPEQTMEFPLILEDLGKVRADLDAEWQRVTREKKRQNKRPPGAPRSAVGRPQNFGVLDFLVYWSGRIPDGVALPATSVTNAPIDRHALTLLQHARAGTMTAVEEAEKILVPLLSLPAELALIQQKMEIIVVSACRDALGLAAESPIQNSRASTQTLSSDAAAEKSIHLAQAIDELFAFLQARADISESEIARFNAMDLQILELAHEQGLAGALPRQSEIERPLNDPTMNLPPVQFLGKVNLPGDWLDTLGRPINALTPANERHFCIVSGARWKEDMMTLRALALTARAKKPHEKPTETSPARLLHEFLWMRAADPALTVGFKGHAHDDLLRLLRAKFDNELGGAPRSIILQSLQDAGCDLLLDWGSSEKYGIQLKSHGDIAHADFARSTMAQIQTSREHGLKGLYVLLAGDMTDRSQEQKVRIFESNISKQNDKYVVTVSPERVWTLLFPDRTETRAEQPHEN